MVMNRNAKMLIDESYSITDVLKMTGGYIF